MVRFRMGKYVGARIITTVSCRRQIILPAPLVVRRRVLNDRVESG